MIPACLLLPACHVSSLYCCHCDSAHSMPHSGSHIYEGTAHMRHHCPPFYEAGMGRRKASGRQAALSLQKDGRHGHCTPLLSCTAHKNPLSLLFSCILSSHLHACLHGTACTACLFLKKKKNRQKQTGKRTGHTHTMEQTSPSTFRIIQSGSQKEKCTIKITHVEEGQELDRKEKGQTG